eukprot:g5866.t1
MSSQFTMKWNLWTPSKHKGIEKEEEVATSAIKKSQKCIGHCEAAKLVIDAAVEVENLEGARTLISEAENELQAAVTEIEKMNWRTRSA